MNINDFNINKNEELLNPCATAYKNTINVFWEKIEKALIYSVSFYYMDVTGLKVVTGSMKVNGSAISTSTFDIIPLDSIYSRHQYERQISLPTFINKSVGNYNLHSFVYRNLYLIEKTFIDSNKFFVISSNLNPGKYIITVIAESKTGELLAQSRGIEIDIIPDRMYGNQDYHGLTSYINNIPSTRYPKIWVLDHYEKE